MRATTFLPAALLCLTAACSSGDGPTADDGRRDLRFTFEQSPEGWTGAFTDYPTFMTEEDLELTFDHRPLPAETGRTGRALFLHGSNHSDDLFMFVKRRVTGLLPNTRYALTFDLDLASNAPSDCGGIGGAPGESVFLKGGAARTEPQRIVVAGDYRLSVDKGEQAQGGRNAVVIDNVANGVPCEDAVPFRMITRDNRQAPPFTISTGADGTLWLFVGTDSGYEGKTSLYYDTIHVVLEPR